MAQNGVEEEEEEREKRGFLIQLSIHSVIVSQSFKFRNFNRQGRKQEKTERGYHETEDYRKEQKKTTEKGNLRKIKRFVQFGIDLAKASTSVSEFADCTNQGYSNNSLGVGLATSLGKGPFFLTL